jgi:heptosyltransferase-2
VKILLIQTSFLGDTILSTPVIAGIKKLYPQSELWMLTTPLGRGLVERDPLLAGVLTFDKRRNDRGIGGLLRKAKELRAMRFDIVYALHRSWRTALLITLAGIPRRVGFEEAKLGFLLHERVARTGVGHEVMRNLVLLSKEAAHETFDMRLRLFASAREELRPELFSALPAEGAYVCVVPGSVWYTKRWHVERYRELIEALCLEGQRVVVLGDRSEQETAHAACAGTQALNLAGHTSIPEMMAIIRGAKALICNDSMALHLGSAFAIPTVAVFCATSPEFGFGPWQNPRSEVVERKGLPCKPCSRHGTKTCPVRTEACMREVQSAEVASAFRRVISAS